MGGRGQGGGRGIEEGGGAGRAGPESLLDSDISLLQDLGWVTSHLAAETQFPRL